MLIAVSAKTIGKPNFKGGKYMEVISEKVGIEKIRAILHPAAHNTNTYSPCPCVGGAPAPLLL